MQVAEAQREVRTVFLNGAIGQVVSGAIWLVSAAFSSAGNRRLGVLQNSLRSLRWCNVLAFWSALVSTTAIIPPCNAPKCCVTPVHSVH